MVVERMLTGLPSTLPLIFPADVSTSMGRLMSKFSNLIS
jgi:hypothetical protein